MIKKTALILIFLLIASSAAFADEEILRHTITLDVLSTGISMFIMAYFYDYTVNNIVFLSALQYEYQLTYRLSAAARFNIKYIRYSGEMLSLSGEGHFRFYPSASAFYVSGMLGYAYFGLTDYGNYNFFVFGPRLGWRIDFGKNKPGGFIMEPSLGYTAAIGERRFVPDVSNLDYDSTFLIRNYLVGGFQVSLGMGWRF